MGSSASKPNTAPAACDEKRDSRDVLPASIVPTSLDGSISKATVAAWEASASANPKLQLARIILSHSDIRSALASRATHVADSFVFNNVVDFKTGPITDQKSSGRCWLFATTNVLRYSIMKRLNLNDFQLSQVCSSLLLGYGV
jgi:bleomycin hydrolase